jgi:cyclic beta-1,2-glucan synthetase
VAGPIRGDPLGAEHLAERAREIARGQRVDAGKRRARTPLLTRLDATRQILDSAHERLSAAAAAEADVGPAGEWLLDNFHVVQQHVREVRESLPSGYYRELPVLRSGPLAGYPRVYEVAITLISHTEGRVDLDNVESFVGAFQQITPLSIGELWAIPAMLRLGCIENIRRMSLRTVQRLVEVEDADAWASRMQRASEMGAGVLLLQLEEFIESVPALTPTFVARLLQQLRTIQGSHRPLVRLEHWIGEEAFGAEEAAARSTQRLVLTQLIMANSITSLRAIARADWLRFVEHQSVMEAALRDDPAAVYQRMTFSTRDHYRHSVERIAKSTGLDEAVVARMSIDLARAAREADPRDERRTHVGYFLVDEGLPALERATGYRASLTEALHRWILHHPTLVFTGAIVLVSLGLLAALFAVVGGPAWSAWAIVLAFTLIPANDVASSIVNQLVTAFLPPRLLPKLDMSDERGGIPREQRTAVVVPTLFGSLSAVQEALEHLEVQFLANRDPHLHFALLGDYTDAPAETMPGDGEIRTAAEAGVRTLNERYAPGTMDAFYLFLRPRRWNAQEGVWMGWERKRGKLGEFNRFVRGSADDAFCSIVGDVSPLREIRYVITLDADTVLPPGTARLLVGALAHPLNVAEYDETTGRVARGYGILQPRVGVSLPSAHRSLFAAIHSGHPGVDPYTTAVSDVYQDLFAEGSFTGKGIYDVDGFERATHGRFPENTLLSHDLIEGSFARAALATDITVYDDYPTRYLTHARRKHRWIRGDWQLLPWLVPIPRSPTPRASNLSALARWKIFDNLRRSVVEISQIILLIASWTVLPGSPLRWTALALLTIAAPWIVSIFLALVRPPLDKSWLAYYASVGHDASTSIKQIALALAFLPHQAWVSASAIFTTLWRLLVSRRHLLEWQTASSAEHLVKGVRHAEWRAMFPAVAAAMGAIGVTLLFALRPDEQAQLETFVALLPMAVLWLASPIIANRLDEPATLPTHRLSTAQRAQAMRYARLHWSFFERFVSERTHWLAPDNYQDDPVPVVAMRTSPTNIGLQLLSIVSANDLGFIGPDEMVERLERVMRSLERLQRFRGHFFNWYALDDLRVLEPAYVSTVDSGNLAGHFLALRQACESIAAGDIAPALAARLRLVGARAYDYAMEMDFRFLFDDSRKLFAIGFQQSTHALDPSFYDLLASEARLASYVAIAKGDVPVDHWFRLDRTLTRSAGATALVSWSGSMFEYLMPSLVMRSLPFTVLDQALLGAVERQVAYGREHGVPWGASESAYNLRDRHLTYQYRAFGVPDLALKRGLGRDLVIAPYASALAALIDPEAALSNLDALEQQGALGEFGFRDAIDYTRPSPGHRFAIVGNYMAHHVGMSLVALTNALTGNLWPQRFHTDPLMRSVELLLHERIPRRLALLEPQVTRADEALPDPKIEQPAIREIGSPDTAHVHIALLGRLPYTIMISAAGGGYSRHDSLAVTRWRSDGTADQTGQFIYVKDVTTGRLWSAAHQPVCAPTERYCALLATDRVTFERSDGDIDTRTEIAVVPEDSAEVRRVTVTNNSRITREIELTSYGEIVLGPPDADRAHPAFANLFVETEWHEWVSAVSATRRSRASVEAPLWCMHVLAVGPERVGAISCETDRAQFLGRGRTPRSPQALDTDGALPGTAGSVLDPIFALRVRLRLEAGQSASVAFTTLVATSGEQAFALADRYNDAHTVQRALDLAWTATQMELRELGVTPADAAMFQELAGWMLFPTMRLRAPQAEVLRNTGSQPMLWAQGISGDWPILLASISGQDGLSALRQIFIAHHYWRRRGMLVDVVVLNEQNTGYIQDLSNLVLDTMYEASDTGVLDKPGGVFIRRADLLSDADRLMLRSTARVLIRCDGRPLGRILESLVSAELAKAEGDDEDEGLPRLTERSGAAPEYPWQLARSPLRRRSAAVHVTPSNSLRALTRRSDRARSTTGFANGFGDLNASDDYEMLVTEGHVPPAPWVNVIANERGGFVVSERGASCTWAANSYFYRLTPWHNDPVSDPVSDVLYLRDDASGEIWSATPAPAGGNAQYSVRHGPGCSVFTHERDGLVCRLTLGLSSDGGVKLSRLEVTNTDARARRITITSYVEWTLGVLREHTQHQVHTEYEPASGAILARNSFDPQFAPWVAFSAMTEPVVAYTADRRELIGRNGSVENPVALASSAKLSASVGVGLDPCAALQCTLDLASGETREVVVLLGAAPGIAEARRLIDVHRAVPRAQAAARGTTDEWERRLSVIKVRTPEPSFDAMVNRWTLYQTLACRVWARSALYQSSGAYGFRDQLQDVLALLYAEPELARAHIVRAASRQFVEGDVQHWWHPTSGRGVRTRFSDDLAWLPFVVEHYVNVTGDDSVLADEAPFLLMRELNPDEHEVYELPQTADEMTSVYDHCVRALRRACTKGVHGLPLIGSGDWNDGMNRVGIEGHGESVWLAWFLITTLRNFATIAERRGDTSTSVELRTFAHDYARAIEDHAWDGAWYRRAYFDDGTPLGSATSEECQIDSIAQSWSVISAAGEPQRVRQAMRSLETRLIDDSARLLMLLAPPFDKTAKDPGYIKGYLPGVRENGAQYTHAALWAVLATALRGDGDRAFELYQYINPLARTRTPEDVATYKVEPYVVAADIYSAAGQRGRGGWTWYTGSASWMYRVGLETILGFTKRGDRLTIEPRVPTSWPEFSIEYRYGDSVYVIMVQEPARSRRERALVTVDGVPIEGRSITLVDDGQRHEVLMRPRTDARLMGISG